MNEDKIQRIRENDYIRFMDDNVKVTPRNACAEMILTALRALLRCVWFIVGSFLLSLLYVLLVKPCKLPAILQLHRDDLRDLKCNRYS